MPLYIFKRNEPIKQIKQSVFPKEKDLQHLFEANLELLLGVRFIASEFFTGDRQRGRIDSLGLDQDGYPTIIEYKKSSKDNVINQGLFYLDWLVDHKGDFTIAAQKACGSDIKIDWSQPRLILVAESFSEYDKYAVNRIGANIELWTYRTYGDDLLYLEPLFITNGKSQRGEGNVPEPVTVKLPDEPRTEISSNEDDEAPAYTINDHLKGKSNAVIELFEALRERIFELGTDDTIVETANKMYISYKHGKNFAEVQIQAKGLRIWLDILPGDLKDPYQLARDVSNVGHHGTGDVEIKLNDITVVSKVVELVEQSYNQTL